MWEDFSEAICQKRHYERMYVENHLVILNLRSYKKTQDRVK